MPRTIKRCKIKRRKVKKTLRKIKGGKTTTTVKLHHKLLRNPSEVELTHKNTDGTITPAKLYNTRPPTYIQKFDISKNITNDANNLKWTEKMMAYVKNAFNKGDATFAELLLYKNEPTLDIKPKYNETYQFDVMNK
jgi:hypothetical protein